MTRPLRIGILGAARITELSLVEPASATGHHLVAVAARSPERAATFARRHGIPRVHETYADLLADDAVDVIYNPLPNALHGQWNAAALEAGKHVIAEKPSATNAEEARAIEDRTARTNLVLMEAFHYPYHPLFRRVGELLADGAVGEIEHVEAILRMPAPPSQDPRWSLALAGGSTMDLGCYSLSCLRLIGPYAGGEPRVVAARAAEREDTPGVDERLLVDVKYPSGVTASGGSDMASCERAFSLSVRGSGGELFVPMFAVPSEDDRLILRRPGREDHVEHLGLRSSYTFQLEAFATAVSGGEPVITDAAWARRTMELVDTAYGKAGMEPRRPATTWWK